MYNGTRAVSFAAVRSSVRAAARIHYGLQERRHCTELIQEMRHSIPSMFVLLNVLNPKRVVPPRRVLALLAFPPSPRPLLELHPHHQLPSSGAQGTLALHLDTSALLAHHHTWTRSPSFSSTSRSLSPTMRMVSPRCHLLHTSLTDLLRDLSSSKTTMPTPTLPSL